METATKFAFDGSDVGCHIDGAHGIAHAKVRLVDLLTYLAHSLHEPSDSQFTKDVTVLIVDLEADTESDDMSEFDDATDLLQSHTQDGLVWLWDGGDLILESGR